MIHHPSGNTNTRKLFIGSKSFMSQKDCLQVAGCCLLQAFLPVHRTATGRPLYFNIVIPWRTLLYRSDPYQSSRSSPWQSVSVSISILQMLYWTRPQSDSYSANREIESRIFKRDSRYISYNTTYSTMIDKPPALSATIAIAIAITIIIRPLCSREPHSPLKLPNSCSTSWKGINLRDLALRPKGNTAR